MEFYLLEQKESVIMIREPETTRLLQGPTARRLYEKRDILEKSVVAVVGFRNQST